MRQTWRWFGPHDQVRLADIRQAGAQGIVTALHHLPAGAPWSATEITTRQNQIAAGSGGMLSWDVVESLPVSEDIKTKGPNLQAHLAAYRQSLEALAAAGLQTICYNFMPVLDWTRTDLRAPMAHGGTAMRFDICAFAAFDIFILQRDGARESYPDALAAQARETYDAMPEAARNSLAQTVGAGLPGSVDHWTLDTLRTALAQYDGIDADTLRQNHIDFLSEVIPTAERSAIASPSDPKER